jgi:hypothetical protein
MLVLLERANCPITMTARPWDRFLVRLRAFRLDCDLAAGASPDASVALALRAQMLVRAQVRRDLARSARRILAVATHAPGARRLPVPISRERVRDCSGEFAELISRLLAVGPVPPQGVARACLLLTDGSGPLYGRASTEELRAELREAADALAAV